MVYLVKIGDIVSRKSYAMDVLFRVIDIKPGNSGSSGNSGNKENICLLKGIDYRIQADAPESDLVVRNCTDVNTCRSALMSRIDKKTRMLYVQSDLHRSKKAYLRDTPKESARKLARPGKVLHLDGDDSYMSTCQNEYSKMGIDAICKFAPEKEQSAVVYRLLAENRPDIVVMTGHDGMSKNISDRDDLNSYKNSKYFIDAVKEARRYDPDLNGLAIFAGACQSCYPQLIRAGANFASAPGRILIHALDPVLVSQKLAYTAFDKVLTPNEVIGNTMSGLDGIGGMQIRGKYRDVFPADLY